MSLNFPSSPSDGDLSSQPNGITYQWQAAKSRWVSISTLGGSSTVVSVGMVAPFAGADASDAAWLYCDGSEVSRIKYATLFSVIGTMYGAGDGSTTFNLPEYRGQFLRGQDDGAGVDPDAAGRTDRGDGVVGDNVGTRQGTANLSHTHSINDPGHTHSNGNTNGSTVRNSGSDRWNRANVGVSVTGITINAAGGSESRPTNIYVRYYIYSGLNLTVKEPQPTALYGVCDGQLGGFKNGGEGMTAVRNSDGLYTVTFDAALPDDNYSIQLTNAQSNNAGFVRTTSKTATGFDFTTQTTAGALFDRDTEIFVYRRP